MMMWSNRNSYTLLARMQNGTILERNFLEFLKKVNVFLRYDTVIPLIGIFPREIKNICSYKFLCTNVYSGSICNWPKLEMTQMILNR